MFSVLIKKEFVTKKKFFFLQLRFKTFEFIRVYSWKQNLKLQ